jgi:pimeloyl-ACP methyl ester carboxylesterase
VKILRDGGHVWVTGRVRVARKGHGLAVNGATSRPAALAGDSPAHSPYPAWGASSTGPDARWESGRDGTNPQVAALDHPDAFSALTLAGTRPVAPGPVDDDLPDHDAATMDRLFSRPKPDWSDRAAVAEFAAAGAEILGDDPAAARQTAERIWDRTPGSEPAVQMANQMRMVFSKLDCKPRWRERLSELAIPALVVHGRRDPFFPVGNGEALAREIPGARLLVLERAATAIPDAAAGEVAAAMLEG